jgi:hypothetical protein
MLNNMRGFIRHGMSELPSGRYRLQNGLPIHVRLINFQDRLVTSAADMLGYLLEQIKEICSCNLDQQRHRRAPYS